MDVIKNIHSDPLLLEHHRLAYNHKFLFYHRDLHDKRKIFCKMNESIAMTYYP